MQWWHLASRRSTKGEEKSDTTRACVRACGTVVSLLLQAHVGTTTFMCAIMTRLLAGITARLIKRFITFIHVFNKPLMHPSLPSLFRPHIYSYQFSLLFIQSSFHSAIYSFSHPSILSVFHLCIHSWIHEFIQPSIQFFILSFIHPSTVKSHPRIHAFCTS